jgi:hypothetical protein
MACRASLRVQNLYYRWSKDFLEAGKKRLAGDTARAATHRRGVVVEVPVRGRIVTDDPSTALAACEAGQGLFQSFELGLAPWLTERAAGAGTQRMVRGAISFVRVLSVAPACPGQTACLP